MASTPQVVYGSPGSQNVVMGSTSVANGNSSTALGYSSLMNGVSGSYGIGAWSISGTTNTGVVINTNLQDCLDELNKWIENRSWYKNKTKHLYRKDEVFYKDLGKIICHWSEVSYIGTKEQMLECISDILLDNGFKEICFTDGEDFTYSDVIKKWVLNDPTPSSLKSQSIHNAQVSALRSMSNKKQSPAQSISISGSIGYVTSNVPGSTNTTTNWSSVTIGKSLTIKDGDDQFTFKIKDKKLIVEQDGKELSLVLKNDEEVNVFTHIRNWFKSLKSDKI